MKKRRSKNLMIGWTFIIGPFIALPCLLVFWGVISFIMRAMASSNSLVVSIAPVINILFSLFGILCILGIFIGFPVRCYLLFVKK